MRFLGDELRAHGAAAVAHAAPEHRDLGAFGVEDGRDDPVVALDEIDAAPTTQRRGLRRIQLRSVERELADRVAVDGQLNLLPRQVSDRDVHGRHRRREAIARLQDRDAGSTVEMSISGSSASRLGG
jgi:hypothetical protein